MAARRVDMHRLQDLVRLHRLRTSQRRIAKLLKMSQKTVIKYRRALQQADLLDGDAEDLPDLDVLKAAVVEYAPARRPPQQSSSVERWSQTISEMMARDAGPRAIFDCLRLDDPDFDASYDSIKRFCRRVRKARGPKPADVAISVVTVAGDVAQIDFGYLGKLLDPETGQERKVYVFVMVLAHSRHMFLDLVTDQKTTTWLSLHIRAFEFFGGVPRTLVPDNLKAAVIRAAFGLKQEPSLNRSYRELARHYGCVIDPTPPYAPEKKGRVEAAVKYVKQNFYRPRTFKNIEQARRELQDWNLGIAATRQHGTTRKAPKELFEQEERCCLLPLAPTRFELVEWKRAKVGRDAHVSFDRRLYSVPWPHLGQIVDVRATSHTVTIYQDAERLATHSRRGPGTRSTHEAHLPEHRRDLRHRDVGYWLDRASEIGPEVRTFAEEIVRRADGQSPLRRLQSILKLLTGYPASRACSACARAHLYGNYTWRGVERILRQNLDIRPGLPGAIYTVGQLDKPRFARSITELLTLAQETSHGLH